MADITDRKLYLGPRLRRLRRDLGINQTRMSEELGVSASYLNHLERNQRPLTAQMLLRLAKTYDLDVRDFVTSADGAVAQDMGEVFADPMFQDLGIPRHEISEVTDGHPAVADAVIRLYRAVVEYRRMPDMIEHVDRAAAAAETPLNWLRERIQERHNHFPDLDDAAEALAGELAEEPSALAVAIQARLAERHGVSVRIVGDAILAGAVRHYDLHRRRLMLSERLNAASRLMALGFQLGLAELQPAIASIIAAAAPPDVASRKLLTIALGNYAAAALAMPYGRFLAAADASLHDMDLLATKFGVSFEHVAHRLTTLGRTGARGLPFFMLRIDAAGNVSKRFAGEDFPFARFGGTCPRWNIHSTFQHPGRILTQIVETPDGRRFFTLARAIRRAATGQATGDLAIGLGCDLKHAARLVYAAGRDLEHEAAMPIGPTCRLCERPHCPERAEPPINRTLEVSEYRRTVYPFPFALR